MQARSKGAASQQVLSPPSVKGLLPLRAVSREHSVPGGRRAQFSASRSVDWLALAGPFRPVHRAAVLSPARSLQSEAACWVVPVLWASRDHLPCG